MNPLQALCAPLTDLPARLWQRLSPQPVVAPSFAARPLGRAALAPVHAHATSTSPELGRGRRAGGPESAPTSGGLVYGPRARVAPGGSGEHGAPDARYDGAGGAPDGREAARRAFADPDGAGAVARAWGRILTPAAWALTDDTPPHWLAQVRRWSPIVAPALIGSLLLTVALFIAARGRAAYAPLPVGATLPALLGVYLLGGALLGVTLYLAPNGVVWALALVGGVPLLLALLLTVVAGVPAGMLTLAVVAALLLLYSRARRRVTRAGAVDVTRFLGAWRRTLDAGYNILLPGERVIATFGVGPRQYATPMQQVSLGGDMVARARATIIYLVNPAEAWRLVDQPENWEAELHERLAAAVRAGLGEWRATAGAPRGAIAQRALSETQAWGRAVGVRIVSARAHDIAVGPLSALQRQPAQDGAPRGPRPTPPMPHAPLPRPGAAPSHPRLYEEEHLRATSPWSQMGQGHERGPEVVVEGGRVARVSAPIAAVASRTAASQPPSEALPSPEALEDLYTAVRNRQITDTTVIRQIARDFIAVARAAYVNQTHLPFDGQVAARQLYDYADAIDQARRR